MVGPAGLTEVITWRSWPIAALSWPVLTPGVMIVTCGLSVDEGDLETDIDPAVNQSLTTGFVGRDVGHENHAGRRQCILYLLPPGIALRPGGRHYGDRRRRW